MENKVQKSSGQARSNECEHFSFEFSQNVHVTGVQRLSNPDLAKKNRNHFETQLTLLERTRLCLAVLSVHAVKGQVGEG
jgi:hypothetical protein